MADLLEFYQTPIVPPDTIYLVSPSMRQRIAESLANMHLLYGADGILRVFWARPEIKDGEVVVIKLGQPRLPSKEFRP